MKNQKGILTLVGIIIIVVAVIIVFGGVFAYQYFSTQKTNNQPQVQNQINQTASQQLSDAVIIDAIDKLEVIKLEKNAQGIYEAKYPEMQGGYNINLITKGDLNGDRFQDAIIWSTGCGASCGSIFTIIINKNGDLSDVFNVDPEGFVTGGAAQYAVKNISIENGIISIKVEIPAFDGSTTNTTLDYKLIGKNLVSL